MVTKMFFISTNLKIKKYSACITLLNGWKKKFFFVCLVMIGKNSFLKFYFDGKFSQGFYLRINFLKKGASTTNKGTSFFAMNNTISSSNCFL